MIHLSFNILFTLVVTATIITGLATAPISWPLPIVSVIAGAYLLSALFDLRRS
jgi:hypothetical protein